MAGRHRAPVDHTVARAATITATGLSLLAVPGSALATTAPTDEALDLISECESGGRNVMNFINDATHTAGGHWMITNTTWREFGGTKFAPTAIQATADQQREIARLIAIKGQPNFGDWNESRHCWGSRMPAAMRGEDVTNVHPGRSARPVPRPVEPAPAPAPKPAPPPVAQDGLTYTAREGDTLTRIAAVNGTTVEELTRLNNLADPNVIFVGQVIRLSGSYTVQSGDTLQKIAEEEHISGGWQALYAANTGVIGTDPNLIIPGQSLVLMDAEGTHNLRGALPDVP